MKDFNYFIESYFVEERIESLFFIIIGLIAILLACFFLLIIKYSFFKGMGISLLVIGIIQLAVGATVYKRSLGDITRVSNYVKYDPQKVKIVELPRIEKVIENFSIYKCIEIILMVCGIYLYIRFNSSPQTFWKGLALGLLIQASITLSLDIIAEKRATFYREQLSKI